MLRFAASALGSVLLVLVRVVARLLSGFRLGRLLRAVSVPHLEEHRLRTSLTVLGVALGVALLVAVVTVNQSVLRGVVDTIGDISGKADLEVSAGSSGFNDALVASVRSVPGVLKVAPVLQQVATIAHPRALGERLFVIGTDWLNEDDNYFRSYESASLDAIKNDPLPFLNATHNLLLGQKLADKLGLSLSDKLSLATGSGKHELEIKGLLEDKGMGHAFDGAIAVMDYQAMQVAFARGHNIDRIDVALQANANLDVVRARLKATLGSGFTVEPPAQKGARVSRMLLGVRTALTMASVIALFVGAFLIHNTMTVSVVQRKREIGTLRALGARRADVRRLLTLEGALLGLIGALFGLFLGASIARGLLRATSGMLNETYLQITLGEVQIDGVLVLAASAVGVLASTVAAALASLQAGTLSPALALRTAGVLSPAPVSEKLSLRELAACALLLTAWGMLQLPVLGPLPLPAFAATGIVLASGVLFLPRLLHLQRALVSRLSAWAPLSLRLSSQNLVRDVGRTTTTVGALMVGVAMVTAFATFIASLTSAIQSWVEQSIPGDIFLTNGASMPGASLRNVPMSDTLRDALLALPEVSDVRRVHVTEIPYQGLSIKLVSMDAEVFARHSTLTTLEGSPEQALRDLRAGKVLVSENFARRFAIHAGDSVALSYERGTRQFQVAAVVVDYTSDMGTLILDRETFVRAYADDRVSTYELYLRPGADANTVRSAIVQRYATSHNLFVLTNREVRSDIQARVDQVFSLLRALEVVALIVALLGIVNALLANMLDRVREIGVLRALGMSRKSVARLVLMEALLIGIVGLLSGVLVGLAVGHVMLHHINIVSTGWYFPFEVSAGSLLELALLTLTAALLAGFYPARKAAQLRITDALSYE